MKKERFKYLVQVYWAEEDGVYVAEVPELPGCATHGKTYEAAVKNANDAIESWIDAAKEAGYEVPEPVATKKFSGKFVLRIDPKLHRKLAIQAKGQGKTLNGFAEDLLQNAVE